MAQRARPPDDISPGEFFTRWLPSMVEEDAERRVRLGDTAASLVFVLDGDAGGEFTLVVAEGRVAGHLGRVTTADLEVRVDLETWRALNRGDLSAPEGLLRRRVRIQGDLILALKLHLIIG
jgi:putative sterol carrier protein